MFRIPRKAIHLSFPSKLVIAAILILVSFQTYDLSFTAGIDSPLKWVFNHLFETGLQSGRDILFPHGPLAFFMYPLQDNLLIAVIVTGLLQLAMIFGIFTLAGAYRKNDLILPILLSGLLINLTGFNLLILANLSLFYLNYFNSKKAYLKYLGFVLTVFACYVKAYVAMLSVSITASFLLLELIRNRKWIHSAKDTSIILLSLFLCWLLIHHSFTGIFRYFIGMLNLSINNSAAAALYPDNSWILIGIFIIALILVPFLQKTKEGTYFGLLFLISIFLSWKHGMAREDIYHARNFFIYAVMLMTLFLLFNKKNIAINFIVIGIGLSAFYLNIGSLPTFSPMHIEFFGINNFIEITAKYKSITEKARNDTDKNLESNILPRQVVDNIGESAVDIYPWDYSIIPANRLNWNPRPVIQSYASYTPWLDRQNAKHFNSETAPEYIIWDLNKLTTDINGGSAESIDYRYLLNDEPNTLISMICNFEMFFKNESFLVLKKRNLPVQVESNTSEPFVSEWDNWIDLPEETGELLRANVKIKNNILGTLKSFFYKDEIFYIYLKMANDEILKYRIVPKNARDGIWLNPFMFQLESRYIHPEIRSIMFKCSNKEYLRDQIEIEWNTSSFHDNSDSTLFSFFHKDSTIDQCHLLDNTISLEKNMDMWSNVDLNLLLPNSYLGSNCYSVKSGSFSPSLELVLDTLGSVPVTIKASVWVKGEKADIPFVISVETMQDGVIEWHAINLREQIIDKSGWNHAFHYLNWDLSTLSETAVFKIYIINQSSKELLIDDFSVNITSTPANL